MGDHMTTEQALLIDYEFCLGCSTCETACMNAHGYAPESTGIHVVRLGPWNTPDTAWHYDFVPLPPDWCDHCRDRISEGLDPACVRHCEYRVISYGEVDELVEAFKTKEKMMMFSPRTSKPSRQSI